MRGLRHVLLWIPAWPNSPDAPDSPDLHCWLFPVQRCRSDPEWLAGTPRLLSAEFLAAPGQTAAERCWEEAREAWINCRNAGLEAIDFALAPNVSLGEKTAAMCVCVVGKDWISASKCLSCLFEKCFSPISFSTKWGFPKIGAPLNHPFKIMFMGFSLK